MKRYTTPQVWKDRRTPNMRVHSICHETKAVLLQKQFVAPKVAVFNCTGGKRAMDRGLLVPERKMRIDINKRVSVLIIKHGDVLAALFVLQSSAERSVVGGPVSNSDTRLALPFVRHIQSEVYA